MSWRFTILIVFFQVHFWPGSFCGVDRWSYPGHWRCHDVSGLPWNGSRKKATVGSITKEIWRLVIFNRVGRNCRSFDITSLLLYIKENRKESRPLSRAGPVEMSSKQVLCKIPYTYRLYVICYKIKALHVWSTGFWQSRPTIKNTSGYILLCHGAVNVLVPLKFKNTYSAKCKCKSFGIFFFSLHI